MTIIKRIDFDEPVIPDDVEAVRAARENLLDALTDVQEYANELRKICGDSCLAECFVKVQETAASMVIDVATATGELESEVWETCCVAWNARDEMERARRAKL